MIDLNEDVECWTNESDGDLVSNLIKESDFQVCSDNYIAIIQDKLGKIIVHNEYEAHKVYCEYAHAKGFSVRKGKSEYFHGTSKVRAKLFTCSKEGSKHLDDDKSGQCSYRRSNERTGCFARIWFTHVADEQFKATKWVKEHNHEMAAPDQRYLLRSARAIGPIKGKLIESHLSAGVRPIDSYNMLVQDCGSVGNVGYTKKDVYNYVNLLKMSKIDAGDSQSVINHFRMKVKEDRLFYWDVQLDMDGRVANIFWRDGRGRMDYELFGDVFTFDTTYRTNKYGLICAPFFGVNHHHQNVMFACGFLSDETITSFQWLFDTFLGSMGGKQPKTLFTDQDAAISNVIPNVFHDSKHRLCQWHISQNAPSHLGKLQLNHDFRKLWHKCMAECDSETEFDWTWKKMMDDYNAVENSWLNNRYKIRHKWSSAFNTDTFYAELQSTSRSESTNCALNGIANRATCLYQFVVSFENLVSGWRTNEGEEDHKSNQGVPTQSIRTSEILKHAGQKYTRTMYKMFENDYSQGTGASDLISESQCDKLMSYYDVVLHGDNKVRQVKFDASSMEITCSCCKFTTMGMLCSHALKVLAMKNVHVIPEQYFLKRWCKDARDRVSDSCESQPYFKVSSESEMVYSSRVLRTSHEIVVQSKGNPEARMIVDKAMEELNENLKAFLHGQNMDLPSNEKEVLGVLGDKEDEIGGPVLDPLYVKPKGVSTKRIYRHWDRQQKKSVKVTKKSNTTKRRKKALQDVSNVIANQPSYSFPSQDSIVLHVQGSGVDWPIEPDRSFEDMLRRVPYGGSQNNRLF